MVLLGKKNAFTEENQFMISSDLLMEKCMGVTSHLCYNRQNWIA